MLEWATPTESEPFTRDVQQIGGFADDIYVTGYPYDAGIPDHRTWCRLSLAGTIAIDPSTNMPPLPPIVVAFAGDNLGDPVGPDYHLSSDGYWYFNSETWPEQPAQGVLLTDADGDQTMVVWFMCLAVLPLTPTP